MPEFSFISGGAVRTVGTTAGASSAATTVTASGSTNTKGTVVELIAATEFDANWILIQLPRLANGSAHYLVDILIGASTEQVIIPDLYAWTRISAGGGPSYLCPVFIPKGSRLSSRCQSSQASATIDVALTLVSGTLLSGGGPPAMVSAYGAVANSMGTAIDPGAVANTDSAWTQITAATDRTHNWLMVSARLGDGSLSASTLWRLSIGIGAATEATLIPDLHFGAEITTDMTTTFVYCLPVSIPSGSRLTARVRSDVTTAGDRAINLKLYGGG